MRMRILLIVYTGIAAFGGLYGSYILIAEYSNWITWSVTLLILEPIGLFCLIVFQPHIVKAQGSNDAARKALSKRNYPWYDATRDDGAGTDAHTGVFRPLETQLEVQRIRRHE